MKYGIPNPFRVGDFFLRKGIGIEMHSIDSGLITKGYLHVYTGEGKGKTTAALGLALRAAGAGFRVFIAQFAKGRFSSELNAIFRYSDLITLKQYGDEAFIRGYPGDEAKSLARKGLEDAK